MVDRSAKFSLLRLVVSNPLLMLSAAAPNVPQMLLNDAAIDPEYGVIDAVVSKVPENDVLVQPVPRASA